MPREIGCAWKKGDRRGEEKQERKKEIGKKQPPCLAEPTLLGQVALSGGLLEI